MLINELKDGFGCRLRELDLSKGKVDDDLILKIKNILFKYKVIIIEDQFFSDEEYLSFMSKFGKPITHILSEFALEHVPEIIKISNYVDSDAREHGVLYGGAYWHSDMAYRKEVGVATSLYAINAPENGPKTMFLDLESGLKSIVNNINFHRELSEVYGLDLQSTKVIHKFGNRRKITDKEENEQKLSSEKCKDHEHCLHDLVVRHPITGTASLFATSGSSFKIEGKSELESIFILNLLEDFIFENSKYYEHSYTKGEIIIWDNISTIHCGKGISPCESKEDSRILHRINIHYGE